MTDEKYEERTQKSTYWWNKPVMNFNNISYSNKRIEDISERSVYTSDIPVKIPSVFKWTEIDIKDNAKMTEVSIFLRMHYISDPSNIFTFNYTPEFIRWALGDKGFILGLYVGSTLCGTVGVIIRRIQVFNEIVKMAEVNFLCAHPKYRGKKMVNVLIDEAIRRSYKCGMEAGIFTTERLIPSPITSLQFYHRALNYEKLYDTKFMMIGEPSELNTHLQIGEPDSKFVLVTEDYYDILYDLYMKNMTTYNLHVVYDRDEFIHYYCNNMFMRTYILMVDGTAKDYVSYFLLDSLVEGRDVVIKAGYAMSYSRNTESPEYMVHNMLKLAKRDGLDVFNMTDTMQNSQVLLIDDNDKDGIPDRTYGLNFVRGTGRLNLNLFNWSCPRMKTNQVCWTTF